MSGIVVRCATATAAGADHAKDWPNDDRAVGLPNDFFAVADGSGPTYGGWHRPVGADESLGGAVAGWVKHAADAPAAAMRAALRQANAAAFAPNWLDTAHDNRVHPTSSIAALGLRDGRAVVGHAGVCRVYRVRGGDVELLAFEHSIAREMRRAGKENEEVIQLFVSAPARLFGFENELEVEIWEGDARDGDLFILCTDGVWTKVDESRLAEHCEGAELEATAQKIVREATQDPHAGDATVVLCRLSLGQGR